MGVSVTDVAPTIGHDQLGRMCYRTIAARYGADGKAALSGGDMAGGCSSGGRFILSNLDSHTFLVIALPFTRYYAIQHD